MRTWETKLMGPLFLCEEYLHRAADLTLVMSQALGKEMNAVGASTGNLLLQNTQWTACVCAGWGLCALKGLDILFKLLWSWYQAGSDDFIGSWVDIHSWTNPHMAKGCGFRHLPPTLQELGNAQSTDVSPHTPFVLRRIVFVLPVQERS
jgi:hypothetical protein